VKDYFHMMLMGYGNERVTSAVPGAAVNPDGFAPLSALVANPQGETPEGRPIFFKDLQAGGSTPMNLFFQKAFGPMSKWSQERNDDFPPILINITDGASTDGVPIDASKKIQGIKGADGNALVFNCHISAWWPDPATGQLTRPKPILFPQSIEDLPKEDEYARHLFEMSSELPPKFLEEAKRMKLVPEDAKSARAMAYNTDIDSLVDFLVIGTRAKETIRD
jgi:hypothetical protein